MRASMPSPLISRHPITRLAARLTLFRGTMAMAVVILLLALPVAGVAQSPQKWVQLPDLTTDGMDVNASNEYLLADDFLCTRTEPILQIYIWGSWKDDIGGDPPPTFTLSFHTDIPANESSTGYSMPSGPLWYRTFTPDEYIAQPYGGRVTEGWLDPPVTYTFPADTTCWLYRFSVPAAEAFYQKGTPDAPVVYWLDVKASPGASGQFFGWKTSRTHWNDDAVWAEGEEIYTGTWSELRYPPGHTLAGQSIDLAFAINDTTALDFGDAPDPTYPTLNASNGARHPVVPGVYLGAGVDVDLDGQPDLAALGDDNDGTDDEDGVWSGSYLHPGQPATVDVTTSTAGWVDGWIDFDRNGDWLDVSDHAFGVAVPGSGTHGIVFTVPAGAATGATFGRVRFNTVGPLPPDGLAADGEVEDFQVEIYPPQSVKWSQLPDLTGAGMDVNASRDFILADDFLCTQTGPITEIRIWGSWLADFLPQGEPDSVRFVLSIHEDIPADQSPTGYSMPGAVLWWRSFRPEFFDVFEYAAGIDEGWMTPPEYYLCSGDTTCWQYRFYVPESEAFVQQGELGAPVVYWLDVKALPLGAEAWFGWKTSQDHWNDDAVWGSGIEPYLGPWEELIYPPDHVLHPESIDLAFEILGLVPQRDLDLGDAPDPTYPTLLASNGASHLIAPAVFLGSGVDAEIDGQPSPFANGDDLNGGDDEDGLTAISSLIQGQPASMDVLVSVNGWLDAWIDYNGDGDWNEADELAVSVAVTAGATTHTFTVPAAAVPDTTFIRLRFNTAGPLSFDGYAADGEVEDYPVEILPVEPPKWRQVPDLGPLGLDVNASRIFLLADDFQCSESGLLTRIVVWGSWEADVLPCDRPDSVKFMLSIHEDIPASQSPTGYSMPGRTLWWHVFNEGEFAVSPWAEGIQEGWLDPPDNYYFPADTVCWQYRFQIPAEEAFEQLGSPNSPVTYWLDLKAIPDAAEATFGWKTSLDHWNDDAVWVVGGEPYSGLWNELRYPEGHQLRGQSMDLAFAVWSEPFPWETDYGDAPDPTHPTLLASDGARHTVDPAVFMGASIDSEPDGQPAPPALGDDVNGIADEDGVSFLSVLGPGAIGRIRVIASADGYLDAWVDFGRDGSWAEPGDLIFRGTVSAGPNLIIFPCPLAAVPGLTCSRFRFNTGANIGYTGRASDGEVEDYTVMLTEAGEVPGGGVPKTFHLYQSTPNPFSNSARIRFDLPRPEKVTLTVIGVDGRRVATLVDRLLSEGEHAAVWDGRDDDGSRAAAGVYYYRLQAGAFERTMKLIFLP